MSKRAALFVVWAGIGFVFSMEWLYLFTPIGPAGLALVLPLVWVLEGRGLNKQPEIWGLLAGPGLFFLLVATSVRPGAWGSCGVRCRYGGLSRVRGFRARSMRAPGLKRSSFRREPIMLIAGFAS